MKSKYIVIKYMFHIINICLKEFFKCIIVLIILAQENKNLFYSWKLYLHKSI